MPTYDYLCDQCGEHVEIFQKITDDPVRECPACKTDHLVRQFGTGAAIVFKGSGFYQTDYRSESYKKGQSSESKSSGGDASSNSSNAPSKSSDGGSASSGTPNSSGGGSPSSTPSAS